MKNLEQLGLAELTHEEMISTNGGSQLLSDIFWILGQAWTANRKANQAMVETGHVPASMRR